MSPLVRAATSALATYRLTKLVLDDEITRELREAAFDKLEQFPDSELAQKITYFLTCPWCVSLWASLAIFVLSKSKAEFLSGALASSAITGLIYEHLG